MKIFILLLGLAVIALLCDAAALQRKQNNKNVPAQKRQNPAGRVNVRAPAAATGNKNKGTSQGQVRKPVAAKVLPKPAQAVKKAAANPAAKPKQTQTPNRGVKKQQNQVKNGNQKADSKPQQQIQKGAGVRRRRRKNAGVAARGKQLKRRKKVGQAGKVGGVGTPRPVGNNNGGVKNAENLAIDGSEDVEDAVEDSAGKEAPLEDGEATEGEGEKDEYEHEYDKEETSDNGAQNNADDERENGNPAAEGDEYEYYYSSEYGYE